MKNTLIAFEKQLNSIALQEENIFKRQEKSVELCVITLRELKAFITKKGFPTKQDEIDFFKTIKPGFESRLKYHVALFDLEKHKPYGCPIAQRKYFEGKLTEINNFIQSNIDFYTYISPEQRIWTISILFGENIIQSLLSNYVFSTLIWILEQAMIIKYHNF